MDKEKAISTIKTIYLYLVALVGIVIMIIGSINTLSIGLRYYIFDIKTPVYETSPKFACEQSGKYYGQGGYMPAVSVDAKGNPVEPAKKPTQAEIDQCTADALADQMDRYRKEQLQSLAWAFAAMIVSFPIWLYHWKIIRKH